MERTASNFRSRLFFINSHLLMKLNKSVFFFEKHGFI